MPPKRAKSDKSKSGNSTMPRELSDELNNETVIDGNIDGQTEVNSDGTVEQPTINNSTTETETSTENENIQVVGETEIGEDHGHEPLPSLDHIRSRQSEPDNAEFDAEMIALADDEYVSNYTNNWYDMPVDTPDERFVQRIYNGVLLESMKAASVVAMDPMGQNMVSIFTSQMNSALKLQSADEKHRFFRQAAQSMAELIRTISNAQPQQMVSQDTFATEPTSNLSPSSTTIELVDWFGISIPRGAELKYFTAVSGNKTSEQLKIVQQWQDWSKSPIKEKHVDKMSDLLISMSKDNFQQLYQVYDQLLNNIDCPSSSRMSVNRLFNLDFSEEFGKFTSSADVENKCLFNSTPTLSNAQLSSSSTSSSIPHAMRSPMNVEEAIEEYTRIREEICDTYSKKPLNLPQFISNIEFVPPNTIKYTVNADFVQDVTIRHCYGVFIYRLLCETIIKVSATSHQQMSDGAKAQILTWLPTAQNNREVESNGQYYDFSNRFTELTFLANLLTPNFGVGFGMLAEIRARITDQYGSTFFNDIGELFGEIKLSYTETWVENYFRIRRIVTHGKVVCRRLCDLPLLRSSMPAWFMLSSEARKSSTVP